MNKKILAVSFILIGSFSTSVFSCDRDFEKNWLEAQKRMDNSRLEMQKSMEQSKRDMERSRLEMQKSMEQSRRDMERSRLEMQKPFEQPKCGFGNLSSSNYSHGSIFNFQSINQNAALAAATEESPYAPFVKRYRDLEKERAAAPAYAFVKAAAEKNRGAEKAREEAEAAEKAWFERAREAAVKNNRNAQKKARAEAERSKEDADFMAAIQASLMESNQQKKSPISSEEDDLNEALLASIKDEEARIAALKLEESEFKKIISISMEPVAAIQSLPQNSSVAKTSPSFEPSIQDEIDIGNIIKGKNLSREEMIKLVVKEGKYTSEQAAVILAEMFD